MYLVNNKLLKLYNSFIIIILGGNSMKNRGFSLIEIVVAVAIMGILSGIVGLQLRSYIAKSKDTKAVATLNTLRVAAQLYQLENERPLIEDSLKYKDPTEIKEAFEKLEPYLDNNAKVISELRMTNFIVKCYVSEC